MESFRSPLYRTSKAGTKEQENQTGYGTLDDHFRVIRSKKPSSSSSSHPASLMRSNIPSFPSKGDSAAASNKLESKPSMDINASAEAFINKFKRQLVIQRLESIENYEQMLARGT